MKRFECSPPAPAAHLLRRTAEVQGYLAQIEREAAAQKQLLEEQARKAAEAGYRSGFESGRTAGMAALQSCDSAAVRLLQRAQMLLVSTVRAVASEVLDYAEQPTEHAAATLQAFEPAPRIAQRLEYMLQMLNEPDSPTRELLCRMLKAELLGK